MSFNVKINKLTGTSLKIEVKPNWTNKTIKPEQTIKIVEYSLMWHFVSSLTLI